MLAQSQLQLNKSLGKTRGFINYPILILFYAKQKFKINDVIWYCIIHSNFIAQIFLKKGELNAYTAFYTSEPLGQEAIWITRCFIAEGKI